MTDKATATVSPHASAGLTDPLSLVQRLSEIGIALSSQNNIDILLETILTEAMRVANAEGGTFYYLNGDETLGQKLEFSIIRNNKLGIAFGGSAPAASFPPIALINPKTGEPDFAKQAVFAVVLKRAVNIEDVYSSDDFDFDGVKAFDKQNNYKTRSILTIPMLNHKQEALGCLQLINATDSHGQPVAFTQSMQLIIQSLASQASIILDNKTLIMAQKELLESFIKLIAKAIDAKSPYTGSHCERVPVLTNMLAQAACEARDGLFKDFNLSDDEKYELHIAGWLHDCGKVTTPVHIMDKATKLEAIYDRVHAIRLRFELLKRDARIQLLEQSAKAVADRAALEKTYQQTLAALDEDMAFIAKSNIGGEFMSDADIDRLKAIAQRYSYEENGQRLPVLNENEVYNLSIRRGTLTAEDRKTMEDHMVHTCAMLEALPFPKHLKRVPEYAGGHHERMDGKGYPKGLRAGDMSVPARMMAVADVFEALTANDRPYKPAKKLSESMNIIGVMKKTHHLDPDIVDFFITSKVYLAFARKYLSDELIDEVDEAALLAIKPEAAKPA
jgi:HD-GYP domain-containing protein (c-di-GMP phosphodiesterase class II)